MHETVLVQYMDMYGKHDATTDDEHLNQRNNINKMQLKIMLVLYGYLNNLNGFKKVSIKTIKIVDAQGDRMVIKE
jgi:hypothetical protein